MSFGRKKGTCYFCKRIRNLQYYNKVGNHSACAECKSLSEGVPSALQGGL